MKTNRYKIMFMVILYLLSLTGCVDQPITPPTESSAPPASTPTPEPAIPTVVETGTPANTPEPTPTTEPEKAQSELMYQLDISLDYSGHSMTISQVRWTIRITPKLVLLKSP